MNQKFINIIDSSAKRLQLSLEEARSAIPHALSKGQALEESLRTFLRQQLPASIGITTGLIFDSCGAFSKQLDVILYDVATTPMIFESPEHGTRVVPAEGVIAVIEVKTRLRPSMLDDIFANASSVKNLSKTAYMDTADFVFGGTNLYGSLRKVCPTIYSVFSFESEGNQAIASKLASENALLPFTERIDNVCMLDFGIALNRLASGQDSFLPEDGASTVCLKADMPLLYWHALAASTYPQVRTRPINLLEYIRAGSQSPDGPQQ